MIDRRSSALVGAMTSLLIVAFAGAARAEDLRREVDALRQNDRTDRGAAMLDNLERGRARPWPRSPGPARPAMPTGCAGRGGGSWNGRSASGRLPWPPALRPRVVGTLRRDGLPDRESRLRDPPGIAGPGPSLRPRGPRPARAGRPVLPRPLVARQQGPAGLPGLLHQHGPARLRRAQLRPVRPGGAGRLIPRPPPHRGAAGRGRPAGVRRVRDPLRAGVPALADRRSIRSGSG